MNSVDRLIEGMDQLIIFKRQSAVAVCKKNIEYIRHKHYFLVK